MKKLIIILFPPILYVISYLFVLLDGPATLSDIYWSSFIIEIVTISIFWFVNIYFFTNLKGDINFSHKKTIINSILSIVWVLVVWFNFLTLLWSVFFIRQYHWRDQFNELLEPLPLKISIFILLTIPIWKYWILKPLFTYRLSVKLKKR